MIARCTVLPPLEVLEVELELEPPLAELPPVLLVELLELELPQAASASTTRRVAMAAPIRFTGWWGGTPLIDGPNDIRSLLVA
jgi:hypothetical protein